MRFLTYLSSGVQSEQVTSDWRSRMEKNRHTPPLTKFLYWDVV